MNALSGDGRVAVGSGHSFALPISWSALSGTHLVDVTGSAFLSDHTVAQRVSADGKVIVGAGQVGKSSEHPGQFEAFHWTADDGMESLGTISPFHVGDPLAVVASAVSDDGSIIVGAAGMDNGEQAFRWTATGGMQGLGDLPGGDFDSQISAMSADGLKLVGAATGENGSQAAIWTAQSGFVPLMGITEDASKSNATAISPDGTFIVGWAQHANRFEAFRSVGDTAPIGIGDLPGGDVLSVARGVSADGNVVVGDSSGYLDALEGFIWDPVRGMRSLTEVLAHDYGLGASLPTYVGDVKGISRDGQVILGGTWIADLRDEPTPGDANFDGRVNLSDFGILKQHFGSGRYRDEGDFTADGKVNLSDFGVLTAAFGTPPTAVPEPPAIGLALLALGSLSAVALVRRALLHARRLARHPPA